MTDKQILSSKLIKVLDAIDFATRYYSFCDSHRTKGDVTTLDIGDFEAALKTLQLDFTYDSKERFFLHEQSHASCQVSLRVAFTISSIEMIFYLKVGRDIIGGPFAVLAKQVAQLRDPNFSHSPAYPKLPFSNKETLMEAVQFGASLFQDSKRVILSTAWKP